MRRRRGPDLPRSTAFNRRGSHATRRARRHVLAQAAETLHGFGHRGLRARGFKGRHVEALVRHWKDRGLSDATTMNRMAHLRWWAGRVGKGGMVRPSADYGMRLSTLIPLRRTSCSPTIRRPAREADRHRRGSRQ
ncbi:MAG: hypothetical protein OXI55_06125 [Gammaproteobacteria bacterium]|nr:hypothetical protein [Gammaproteobacteria bacterium]